MNRFTFWQKWLLIVSLGITAFGLFMAFFNQTPLFDLFNQQIDPSFWDSTPLPEGVTSFQSWLYGVWGATIAGWGIFLAFIAYIPFKQQEKWAWNCLVVGLGVWFVLDTAISWQYGVSFNVIFNIVVALATGMPLVFTRKAFVG
jgi:hypothetical protein